MLIILAISIGIGFIGGLVDGLMGIDIANNENKFTVGNLIIEIGAVILSIASTTCFIYYLKFIRTGSAEIKDIVQCFKKKWVDILVVSILIGIFTALWTCLLIVPGIIAALSYSMAIPLIIDQDLKPMDAIKKSKEMMKGYKWNYLVFGLSFIGWFILSPFTLCILFIWLIPYMIVAETLYYEKLKSLSN